MKLQLQHDGRLSVRGDNFTLDLDRAHPAFPEMLAEYARGGGELIVPPTFTVAEPPPHLDGTDVSHFLPIDDSQPDSPSEGEALAKATAARWNERESQGDEIPHDELEADAACLEGLGWAVEFRGMEGWVARPCEDNEPCGPWSAGKLYRGGCWHDREEAETLYGKPTALSMADLHERIEDAAAKTHLSPTPAQAEAGNYRKGRFTAHGLPITIENPRGSTRSGTRPDGTTWTVTMPLAYGYIRTAGTDFQKSKADGDHVDCFLGPHPASTQVFVVDQCKADGSFDEHKALLFFRNEQEARAGYLSAHSKGWKCGPIKALTMPAFKQWLEEGHTGEPIGGQAIQLSVHDVSEEGRDPAGKWTHGAKATSLAAKHAELKAALEAHHKERHAAFGEIKGRADEAARKAGELAGTLLGNVDNIAWLAEKDGDYHADLEQAVHDYDDAETPGEKFEQLKNIEAEAKSFMAAKPTMESSPGADDGLSDKDVAENAKRAAAIVTNARAAREQLRTYVKHRKEMKAIKEGQPISLSAAEPLPMPDGSAEWTEPIALSTATHDVSHEARDAAGKWTKGGSRSESILKAARAIEVTNDAAGSGLVRDRDYEEIERRMTAAHVREMEHELAETKYAALDDDDFVPDAEARRRASRYDDDKAKQEYLRKFYQEHYELFEAAETPEDKWLKDWTGDDILKFTTPAGQYEVKAAYYPVGDLRVPFMQFSDPGGSFEVTGGGNAFRVFAKVVPAVTAYVQKKDLDIATFAAAEPSRQRLYDRLVKTTLETLMPDYFASTLDKGGVRHYVVGKRAKKTALLKAADASVALGGVMRPLVLSSAHDAGWRDVEPEIREEWWTPEGWPELDDGDAIALSTAHAPAGHGEKNKFYIGGKSFLGGQFVPPEVVARGSEDEKTGLVTKESHELTGAEFAKTKSASERPAVVKRWHEKAVREAHKAGKAVPENVLAEYPKLTAKAAAPAIPPHLQTQAEYIAAKESEKSTGIVEPNPDAERLISVESPALRGAANPGPDPGHERKVMSQTIVKVPIPGDREDHETTAEHAEPLSNSAGRVVLHDDRMPELEIIPDDGMKKVGIKSIRRVGFEPQMVGDEEVIEMGTNLDKTKGPAKIRLASRPELRALIANRKEIWLAIAAARSIYRLDLANKVDSLAREKMEAQASELLKKIPADHVQVGAESRSDGDGGQGMPIYRVGDVEIPWNHPELVRHGTASAIRPGAMGAFETHHVASIPKAAVAKLRAERDAAFRATGLAREAKSSEAAAQKAAAFAEAKATGKKAAIRTWTEDVEEEDNSLNVVTEYAMPDGSTKIERMGTY